MGSTDKVFNGIAEKFRRNIYHSNKGYIRLNVLWSDMNESIPLLSKTSMRILDAGGGIGQIAVKCAELGHTIDLCDPSADMLALAKEEIAEKKVSDKITLIHSSVQDLPTHIETTYSLVLFHAVLEWLESPKETLEKLLTFVAPGGTLSLMFYNRNSAIMRTVLKGNFFRKEDSFQFGNAKTLTPANPLNQEDVLSWLSEWGLTVKSKCGIRIFNDYLQSAVSPADLDKLLAVEKDFCRVEPFASLGRYIHVVCEKPLV